MINLKILKKNQVLIYVIALMLIVAGYLNYSGSENDIDKTLQATASAEELAGLNNIGDAKLVNTNIVDETNQIINETVENIAENNVVTSNEINVNATNTSEENMVNENIIQTNTAEITDYFTKSKLERDTMYSQMIETYDKILNSSNSSETQKQSATEEIKKINDEKNSIMICENLISTKGFENNIVFVNGTSISVIIGADDLSQEEIAQIQNIVSRELNAKIENIHIALK